MTVYLGFKRETEVSVMPHDLGCGAGAVTCFECGGDGDWTKFHPELHSLREPLKCVDCKGAGLVLVSI